MRRAASLPLALALGALPSLLPAAARGDEAASEPYVVKAGDSCQLIAERLLGGRPGIARLHEANPELGPTPHHLRPGQALRLPRLGGPDAHLTLVRNQVETFTPERRPGQLNAPLLRGNRVGTLGSSSAEVTYRDQSRLQLAEHTLVVILGGEGAPRATPVGSTLLRGTLRAHLGELAGGMPLQTPGAELRLGAGEVQVHVDAAEATRLSVYRGASVLRASARSVRVPEGFGSRADKGKAPTAPRPLPPPPLWRHAPPELRLGPAGGADLEGDYEPGAGPAPARLRVQLARDEGFRELVLDSVVPGDTRALSARGLPEGAYYARVAAIDSEGMEGPPGAVARTRVALLRLSRGGPGQRAAVEVPADVPCALDRQEPALQRGPMPLQPGRAHVVRCGAAGQEATFPVAATEAGPVQLQAYDLGAAGPGLRRVLLRLQDAEGAALPGARLGAVPGSGLTFEAAQELAAAGQYEVLVRGLAEGPAPPFPILIGGAVAQQVRLQPAPAAPPGDGARRSGSATSPRGGGR